MGELHRRRVGRLWAVAGLALVVLATAPGVAAGAGAKPKAALQMTPNQHSYGTVPVGATSAPFTYTVTNAGAAASGPLSLSITGRQALEFPVVTGGAGACTSGVTSLAAGASCVIAVAFAPLQPLGKKSATLTISDGPGTGSPKASLTGTGGAPASLALTPASVDFGQAAAGHGSVLHALTVTNGGSAPSGPISYTTTGANAGDFFAQAAVTNGCVSGTTTLAIGASCTIDMYFLPSAIGSLGQKSGTLQVSTSNTSEGAPSAALTGESTPPDVLGLSPTSHDFGEVAAGATSTTTFTVTNTGPQTSAPVHTVVEGTDAAEFTIGNLTDHCTGPALEVGASCTFDVTFAPTSGGAKSATVSVWTVKSDFPTATLTGNAGASGCTVGSNTGCVTLDEVVVQKLDAVGPPPTYGIPQYTLSGSVSFSPTCQVLTAGCDYSNYQDYFVGSGTFSLDDGTNVVSGTWTATFYSSQVAAPLYEDASLNVTDCASAAIRQLTGIVHFTDGTDSWQTNFIEIRTDTTASGPYKNMVYMNGITGPSGLQGNYHTSDMSGATISC